MRSNVIAYYSRTGTTRQVAEAIAIKTGWSLGEVQDVRSRAGWLGDLRCVLDNLLRRNPRYRYFGPPLSDCELLVVLAPVWVGHLAAPMRSFLRDRAPLQARLAAVCVMASRGGFNAVEEMATSSGATPSPMLVLLQRDVMNGEAMPQITDFLDVLRRQPLERNLKNRPAWLSPRDA